MEYPIKHFKIKTVLIKLSKKRVLFQTSLIFLCVLLFGNYIFEIITSVIRAIFPLFSLSFNYMASLDGLYSYTFFLIYAGCCVFFLISSSNVITETIFGE